MEGSPRSETAGLGHGGAVGSRYLLDEEIGHGGMGTVWSGIDRNTGARRAIKILHPEFVDDPKVVSRFVRERAALRKVRHPNVVTVHDLVVEGDRLALVLDFVSGENLSEYRRRKGGTLPSAKAADLLCQVCAALVAVHAAQIVHRDVKPANVLLDDGDPEAPVRLADFGIARLFDGTALTATDALLGTAAYLAPELTSGGKAGPPADVYAVGMTLYELVVGKAPFTGGHPVAVLRRHDESRIRRLDGIPDQIWDLVVACTAKDPAVRIGTEDLAKRLAEAAAELREVPALPRTTEQTWELLSDDPIPEIPDGPIPEASTREDRAPVTRINEPRPGLRPRRRRLVAAATTAAFAVLAVGAALLVDGSLLPDRPHASTTSSPPVGAVPGSTRTGGASGASRGLGATGGPGGAIATPGVSASPGASLAPSSPNSPRSLGPHPRRSTTPPRTRLQWSCGPSYMYDSYPQGYITSCIAARDGTVSLKATATNVSPQYGNKIRLYLTLQNAQTGATYGNYTNQICGAGTCTYSIDVRPPHGSWQLLSQAELAYNNQPPGRGSTSSPVSN